MVRSFCTSHWFLTGCQTCFLVGFRLELGFPTPLSSFFFLLLPFLPPPSVPCLCLCVHVQAHVYGGWEWPWRSENKLRCPSSRVIYLSVVVVDMELSLAWNSPSRLSWLLSDPQIVHISCSLVLGLQICTTRDFHMLGKHSTTD